MAIKMVKITFTYVIKVWYDLEIAPSILRLKKNPDLKFTLWTNSMGYGFDDLESAKKYLSEEYLKVLCVGFQTEISEDYKEAEIWKS